MNNHHSSSNQEKTKICPACGIRKPLSDFLLHPLDHIKQYDDLCNTCRNRNARSWKKRSTKPQEEDEDEGGSGGKTRRHVIDYYAKLLSKQMQELSSDQESLDKKFYRDGIDKTREESLLEKTAKELAKEKKETTQQKTETKKSKKITQREKKTTSLFAHSAQTFRGYTIPNQTGAMTLWADLFRQFLNFSVMMNNPAIFLYNIKIQMSLLSYFSPLFHTTAGAGNISPILKNPQLQVKKSEMHKLFHQAQNHSQKETSTPNRPNKYAYHKHGTKT